MFSISLLALLEYQFEGPLGVIVVRFRGHLAFFGTSEALLGPGQAVLCLHALLMSSEVSLLELS